MHTENLEDWQHTHVFGQDQKRPGEIRTIIVIVITATMMVVEIAGGIVFGSMALLADGLHMGSHAVALGITAFAYVYARRRAHDAAFSFGTGKVNALGGYTGAVLLGVFALMMVWESVDRLINPVAIAFNQAIAVAFIGLVVNGASVLILGHEGHDHHHHHQGEDEHGHHGHRHSDSDHNLRAAYFHVLADALTSILAIAALLAAKYWGFNWADPAMGIVGAFLVARWAWGLVKASSSVLLDKQADESLRENVINSIETNNTDRVADLHIWSIGPGIRAAEICVVTHEPHPPDHYRALIPDEANIVHATIEVQHCTSRH